MIRRRQGRDDEVIVDPNDLDLPAKPRVVRIRAEPYVDCAGEDALEVWLVMADSTSEKHMDFHHVEPIRDRVREHLRDEGDDR